MNHSNQDQMTVETSTTQTPVARLATVSQVATVSQNVVASCNMRRAMGLVLMMVVLLSGNAQAGMSFVERLFTGKPPMVEEFDKIYAQPYELGVQDCSNKAGRYARALLAKGYNAEVVLVRPSDKDSLLHAIVVIHEKDRDWVCDPTTGRWSKSLKTAGEVWGTVGKPALETDEDYSQVAVAAAEVVA